MSAAAKQSPPACQWNTTEPPKDGTTIVAIGKVMFSDDFFTSADPFLTYLNWRKTDSGYEGWLLPSGMTLASTLDDEVIIHFWMPEPKEGA